jgi:hypothetical protein
MSDLMTRAEFERLASDNARATTFVPSCEIAADDIVRALNAASGETVSFHGIVSQDDRYPADHTFTADSYKGFIKFEIAHSLPVVNYYGQAFHPKVLANSYRSLLFQNINWEHQVKAFSEQHWNDKFLGGAVVGVHFPTEPSSGWRVPESGAAVPHITGVASFAKLASGMQTIIGKHKTGKHSYQISYEANFYFSETAFAVALNGARPTHETPDDLVAAGWEYIPWAESDDELLKTYNRKKGRIVSDYRGRRVVQLMGGLDKSVEFSGVGLVLYSAEGPSKIMHIAASADVKDDPLLPLRQLAQLAANSARR